MRGCITSPLWSVVSWLSSSVWLWIRDRCDLMSTSIAICDSCAAWCNPNTKHTIDIGARQEQQGGSAASICLLRASLVSSKILNCQTFRALVYSAMNIWVIAREQIHTLDNLLIVIRQLDCDMIWRYWPVGCCHWCIVELGCAQLCILVMAGEATPASYEVTDCVVW